MPKYNTSWVLKNFLLLVPLLVLLSTVGCSNIRYIPDGQSLLVKNKIHLDNQQKVKKAKDLTYDLKRLARPSPNKKTLGLLRTRLWIYNHTQKSKKGLGKWLNEKVGEEAVLADSTVMERSAQVMNSFLANRGYFYNKVRYETVTSRKKTKVHYYLNTYEPYRIDSVYYPKEKDNEVYKIIEEVAQNSPLKKGTTFNGGHINSEINSIVSKLRNKGYYDFNKQYLHYKIDSNKTDKKLNLYLEVRPHPKDSAHQVYRINKIYVLPQYNANLPTSTYVDTMVIGEKFKFHYVTPEFKRFKPNVIVDYLLVKTNEPYSQLKYEYTVNHLLDLGVFKFVNVRYKKIEVNGQRKLDCFVLMTPSPKMNFSAEFEVNNRSQSSAVTKSLLGTAVTFSYGNKNIFKGAEALNFNIFSGFEFDLDPTTALINTMDLSGEVKLTFPKFITPIKIKRVSKFYRPKTQVGVGFTGIRRFNFYTLYSTNLSFGYDWREDARKRHILNPIAINLLRVFNQSDQFLEQLDENRLLEKSFEGQYIVGANYTFIYTTQEINSRKNFIYFRGNVDASGNFLFGVQKLLQAAGTLQDGFNILGNPIAKYNRFDADLRHYTFISKQTKLVSRIAAGIGIPYGDTDPVLPYVKQFFMGGTNSLRAFRIRNIGPGSLPNTVYETNSETGVTDTLIIDEFDRTGDMKLEANLEYRFDIFSIFKGAAFIDVGNVWKLRDADADSKFVVKNFASQLGIGTGLGMRLDFSYFVLRFDLAFPLRDPREPEGERWRFKQINPGDKAWRKDNLRLNLAIGYPF